jgi:CheY-like chemotaxis protein
LTRQLLAFSRKQVLQPSDLDMNEIVAHTTQMLHRILGEDIELVVQPAPAPALVHGDAGMMEQVLMNLAVNARDAMPAGGRLVISTSLEQIDETFLREHPATAQPGPFVRVRVTDTGTGIAHEHLPRIFEPFFTTKDVNRGTGLGLATAYGIAKQHGGWIDVQSEVGRGATFDLYLPATDRPPAPAPAQPPAELVITGCETILVVEDETPLRALARTILERHGYRVLDAGDGVTALAVWQAHAHEIDLDAAAAEGVPAEAVHAAAAARDDQALPRRRGRGAQHSVARRDQSAGCRLGRTMSRTLRRRSSGENGFCRTRLPSDAASP